MGSGVPGSGQHTPDTKLPTFLGLRTRDRAASGWSRELEHPFAPTVLCSARVPAPHLMKSTTGSYSARYPPPIVDLTHSNSAVFYHCVPPDELHRLVQGEAQLRLRDLGLDLRAGCGVGEGCRA